MSGDFKLKNIKILFQVIAKIKNWPTYIIDLFSLSPGKTLILNARNGERFFIRANTTDRGIVTTVAIQDEYKLGELNLHDATILDIGGQNGYFSVFASKFAKKVYTFEPFAENYENILINRELNKLKNKIVPHNLAVSNKKKTLKIFLSPNTGGHSIYGDGKYFTVETTTIPDIFTKYNINFCDLIKMDVEGSEYDILYNLPNSYFEKIARIRMEVHVCDNKKNNPQSMITFLKQKGYAVDYKEPLLFASSIKKKDK